MSLIYSRADVYVEERDLSQVVANVNTSIGAIVYAGKRGRLEPQLFTTLQDWIDFPGAPDASVSFAGYGALAFLEFSDNLWGQRAIGSGYSFGGIALQKKTSTPIALVPGSSSDPRPIGSPGGTGGQDVDWATLCGAGNVQDNLAYFFADGPGSYSSTLSIEIDSDNLTVPTGVSAADASTVGPLIAGIDTAGAINPGTYSYKVTAVNNVGETLASANANVTITVSGTSNFITWNPVVGAQGYKIYGRTTSSYLYIATVGANAGYYIDYGTITPAGVPPSSQNFTDVFTVKVFDSDISPNQPVEQFDCSMLEKVDGFGRQLEITQAINGYSKKIRVLSNASAFLSGTIPVVYNLAKTALSAGSSGAAVTASNIINAWDAFADKDKIDVRILINGGYSIPSVQQKMNSLCQSRGDCFAILDVPSDQQQAQQAIDYRNLTLNLNSNRAAMYAPDVNINDPYSGKVLFVPPSGHIAGVYAYTDRTTYPWFAPAGLNRGLLSVLGIRYRYTAGERDNLHNAQVNYIRNQPGLGIAVWEERTQQAATSALSFINVRRMLDTIEIAVSRAQNFNLFEPNDDFTRTQIRSAITDYLTLVKNARGINNFLVICDKRNNPPAQVAQGQLRVDLLIEPTLPAEKIVLRVSVTKQGADFQELIANGALN